MLLGRESQMSRDDDISSELRAKLDATIDQILPSMVCFFRGQPHERPALDASGFLVMLEDGRPRVVTAGHVFDGGKPGQIFAMGGPKSPLIPLKGSPSRSRSPDSGGEDRLDFASFSLDPKMTETLGTFTPLGAHDLQLPRAYHPGRRYAVAGFRAAKNKKPLLAGQPIPSGLELIVARERPPALGPVRDWVREDLHLTLTWDHEVAFHSDGGHHKPAKLDGMSGGVVLDLGTDLDPLTRPKAIGVFTHHLKGEKALVATRMLPLIRVHQAGPPIPPVAGEDS